MGVMTTVDENLQKAQDHLDDAYKCLSVVIDSSSWGHDEYSKEYMAKMEKITLKLLKLKRKLNE